MIENINRGAFLGDPAAENIYDAFGKVNANNNEYNALISDAQQYQNTNVTNGRRRKYILEQNFDFNNIPADYDNAIWEIRFPYDLAGNTITLPANVTLQFNNGRFDNGEIVGNNTSVFNDIKSIFNVSNLKFSGTWDVVITPYMFGVDGVNDTAALNRSITAGKEMNCPIEWLGNFKSNTVTIGENVKLNTNCEIESITDVNIIEVIGKGNGYGSNVIKLAHTGFLKLVGIDRTGSSKGIFLNNGAQDTSFDKVAISNVALGVSYGTLGNNNGISFASLEIKSTSKSYFTANYTLGAVVSPSFINDIGELITTEPIDISTGFIAMGNMNVAGTALDTNCKTYPICAKPGTTDTYYIGGFTELNPTHSLAYWTGGGVHHGDHTDNGACRYGILSMISIDGMTLNVQSFYGITVNSGHLEGAYTNINVGGIRVNKFDNVTPEIIFSIRSIFSGLHTEAFLSQSPLVYSLGGAHIEFIGNLMAQRIRILGAENGIKYNSKTGSDRVSNVYYVEGDAATFQPVDPTFEIYREVGIDRVTFLNLSNLSTDMEYLGDPRINHMTIGKVHLLNIPVGALRRITVTPLGTNTLLGNTTPINIDVIGVEGQTINTVYFLLEGDNFTYFTNTIDSTNFITRADSNINIINPIDINTAIAYVNDNGDYNVPDSFSSVLLHGATRSDNNLSENVYDVDNILVGAAGIAIRNEDNNNNHEPYFLTTKPLGNLITPGQKVFTPYKIWHEGNSIIPEIGYLEVAEEPGTTNTSIVPITKGKVIAFTGATDLNISIDSTSFNNIGDFTLVEQLNSNIIQFVAGAGVTLLIDPDQTLFLKGINSRVTIQKTDVDTYRIFGDLKSIIAANTIEYITVNFELPDSATFVGQITIVNVSTNALFVNTIELDKLNGLDSQAIYPDESFQIVKESTNNYRII